MKRKTVFLIVLLALFAIYAHGQQYCPEWDFQVAPVGGGVSVQIVRYIGTNWTVRIPPRIRNLPVTHIGEGAFNNRNLIAVTIPNSVTHIGWRAFANNQLTSIIIPNSVITIQNEAFTNNLLSSIVIGNRVRQLGDGLGFGVFSNNRLTSVTIPDSVTFIGRFAFHNNQLTTVTIPFASLEEADYAWRVDWRTRAGIPSNVRILLSL